MTFLKKSLALIGTQVVLFGLSFAASVLTARTLGPTGKGQLAIITTSTSFLVLLTSVGLGASVVYYLNRQNNGRTSVIFCAFLIQSILVMPVMLLATVGASYLSSIFSNNQLDPLMIVVAALIGLPAGTVLGIANNSLIALQHVRDYGLLQILTAGIQIGLLASLAVVDRLTTLSAVAVFALAPLPAIVISYYRLKAAGVILVNFPDLDLIRRMILYGGRAWLGNMLQYFNYRVDVFIVFFLLGAGAVGIYAVAVSLAELIWYIPGAVSTILFPRTAMDWNRATQFTPRVSRNALVVMTILAIFMAITGPILFKVVYGEQFSDSFAPLWVLLPGVVFLGVGKILAGDLACRGKPEYWTYSAGVSLVATVLLDFVLIPVMGIVGAALASTVSYAIAAFLLLMLYVRISKNTAFSVLLISSEDFEVYLAFLRKARVFLLARTLS